MANRQSPIAFTGGGSAGHVTPGLGPLRQLKADGVPLVYFGSVQGIEREMIAQEGVPYIALPTGKLRRYFSWQNFIDPVKIVFGILLAFVHMIRQRPRLLFSTGGFAGVPPIVAAWVLRIPIAIYENDRTPGLANKIAARFAGRICVANSESSLLTSHASRTTFTGPPIRGGLFSGDRDRGLAFAGLDGARPVLLVVGGSLGAKAINETIWAAFDDLTQKFDIVHICGPGQCKAELVNHAHYRAFEFVRDEYADLLAAADFVVSRAGANALAELVALEKPHLVIPLTRAQSRGDQIENAEEAQANGTSLVLLEEDLTARTLLFALEELAAKAPTLKAAMATAPYDKGGAKLLAVMLEAAG
ncbi:MAG: undecaprenyldiphospho-muramoylpentapeptide beta-N-acetylglucosaminyltransferase [Alphaproteobacteria bacterium]